MSVQYQLSIFFVENFTARKERIYETILSSSCLGGTRQKSLARFGSMLGRWWCGCDHFIYTKLLVLKVCQIQFHMLCLAEERNGI